MMITLMLIMKKPIEANDADDRKPIEADDDDNVDADNDRKPIEAEYENNDRKPIEADEDKGVFELGQRSLSRGNVVDEKPGVRPLLVHFFVVMMIKIEIKIIQIIIMS